MGGSGSLLAGSGTQSLAPLQLAPYSFSISNAARLGVISQKLFFRAPPARAALKEIVA
jgi:hypothetical protein